MGNRPQTLYGIEDSPVGLAAWMLDHDARSYALIARVFAGQTEGLTRDDILDNVTLYWLTNTAVSSARLYWESKLPFFAPKGRRHTRRRQRLSRRDLYGPAKLDGKSLPEAHLLQPACQRRPLCGLGAAEDLRRGVASGVPIAAPTDVKEIPAAGFRAAPGKHDDAETSTSWSDTLKRIAGRVSIFFGTAAQPFSSAYEPLAPTLIDIEP